MTRALCPPDCKRRHFHRTLTNPGNHLFGRRVTNQDIAAAAFGIEQGLRAIERYRIPTCIEHGFRLSRCKELGLYHANGKTHHHVFVGPCVDNCRRKK